MSRRARSRPNKRAPLPEPQPINWDALKADQQRQTTSTTPQKGTTP